MVIVVTGIDSLSSEAAEAFSNQAGLLSEGKPDEDKKIVVLATANKDVNADIKRRATMVVLDFPEETAREKILRAYFLDAENVRNAEYVLMDPYKYYAKNTPKRNLDFFHVLVECL